MALRGPLGWSEGELMRLDAKPCSRLMRQTAAIFSVGGGLAFWVLCCLHYGSKNNCSEKSEVGFLRCNISELLIGSSGPTFQS